MEYSEEIDIVIAGGGICGLATALALHGKGIKSVILKRSETLRATGLLSIFLPMGGLGVASKLRHTALPFQRIGEARCLQRSNLITALAESLPHGTIRFGCQVLSVQPDPLTLYPLIQLHNGCVIKAKILIGCDGAHSVVADFLELKPLKLFNLWTIRGLTCYPNCHGLPTKSVRFRGENFTVGRVPMDDKLVTGLFRTKDILQLLIYIFGPPTTYLIIHVS
ncbi:hypothetical protein SLA2020_075360 [Shorea laevis]